MIWSVFVLPYVACTPASVEVAAPLVPARIDDDGCNTPPRGYSVALNAPASCTTPCTFSASTTGGVASVRYEADGWLLGTATDGQDGFTLVASFNTLGLRRIAAIALDHLGLRSPSTRPTWLSRRRAWRPATSGPIEAAPAASNWSRMR